MRQLHLVLIFVILGSLAFGQSTSPVSRAPGGGVANNRSGSAAISADGRWVAFQSLASNLVSGDTNGKFDIFLHDRQTGQTSRISLTSAGAQVNDDSYSPSVSGDGHYVAFASRSSNLVSDGNHAIDIFVRDVQAGQTTRVSVNSAGAEGNGDSFSPSVSADGRYVAFQSNASNLVSGDTNGTADIFVKDRQTGQTSRVSVATGGAQASGASWTPSISGDGRFVAFCSNGPNLVNGDTNDCWDIFVHDRQTGATSRVSNATGGVQADADSGSPAISSDGRFVAFASWAGNLRSAISLPSQEIYTHDRLTGQTSLVTASPDGTEGNGNSSAPAISSDGRYVAFQSWADNLVSGDNNGYWDVFVRDRQTGRTFCASQVSGGVQGDRDSDQPALSGDGQTVAFVSWATNLVSGDTNAVTDVFAHVLPASGLLGDLDHDGHLDALDMSILGYYLTGLALPPGTATGEADLTQDGRVSAADLVRLVNLLAGNL